MTLIIIVQVISLILLVYALFQLKAFNKMLDEHDHPTQPHIVTKLNEIEEKTEAHQKWLRRIQNWVNDQKTGRNAHDDMAE